jgi:hypothetical protein
MELSTALGTPDYLNLTASLALELAQGLSPPTEIFKRAGFSEADAVTLLRSPEFRVMVKAAKGEWDGLQNTPERIKLKAQMALEELMLPQFQMASNANTPATARIEAFKSFERLAATTKEDSGPNTGPKFILNINLGEVTKEIEGTVLEGTDEEKLLEPAA